MNLKEKYKANCIILASKSPRRKELLNLLDIDFSTTSLSVQETYPFDLKGKHITEHICKKKAKTYSFSNENEIVITADTLVMTEDQTLGKPKNEGEAKSILRQLANRQHQVISSFCVASTTKMTVQSDIANVFMSDLDDEEIEYYVTNYKPFDKAGAYGIQEWIGAVGVEKIEGSYYTIMGLPIHKLYKVLVNFL